MKIPGTGVDTDCRRKRKVPQSRSSPLSGKDCVDPFGGAALRHLPFSVTVSVCTSSRNYYTLGQFFMAWIAYFVWTLCSFFTCMDGIFCTFIAHALYYMHLSPITHAIIVFKVIMYMSCLTLWRSEKKNYLK